MASSHSADLVLPGEYVVTTVYPSAASLMQIASPSPPMPPVTSAIRFVIAMIEFLRFVICRTAVGQPSTASAPPKLPIAVRKAPATTTSDNRLSNVERAAAHGCVMPPC